MRVRSWCFTYFPTDTLDIYERSEGMSYLTYGFEISPETKRPHYQGYVFWEAKKSLTQCRDWLEAHWTPCKGTPQQNITYCQKDGDYYESGEQPIKGQRNDLVEFREAAKRKRGVTELEAVEEFPSIVARYPRFVATVNRVYSQSRTGPPIVIVFWGPTGTGKSRTANLLASYLGSCYRVPQGKKQHII